MHFLCRKWCSKINYFSLMSCEEQPCIQQTSDVFGLYVCFVGLPSWWHIYPTSYFIDVYIECNDIPDWLNNYITHIYFRLDGIWIDSQNVLFTLNQDKREKWSFGPIRFQTRGHKMSKWEERPPCFCVLIQIGLTIYRY